MSDDSIDSAALERGLILVQQGRFPEGKTYLLQAVAANPHDPQALALLATCQYHIDGEEADALATIEHALALAPLEPHYHALRACILVALRRPRPALESAAEHFTKKRRATTVERVDVEEAIAQLTGGVEWDEDALARVLSAPDFNRAGIKKAAEFNARKEGIARITSSDLTRFRNSAMMRAVQRMKGFGMKELSFDAYEIARDRVPRLKDNPEADKRFDTIRNFVAARENPGDLLGQDLLDKMKAQLKANK